MNVSALVKRIAIKLAGASPAGGRKQSSNGKTCHECPAGRWSRNSTTLLSSTDCFIHAVGAIAGLTRQPGTSCGMR